MRERLGAAGKENALLSSPWLATSDLEDEGEEMEMSLVGWISHVSVLIFNYFFF